MLSDCAHVPALVAPGLHRREGGRRAGGSGTSPTSTSRDASPTICIRTRRPCGWSAPHVIEGETGGDLRGRGIWTLEEPLGDDATRVRFDWRRARGPQAPARGSHRSCAPPCAGTTTGRSPVHRGAGAVRSRASNELTRERRAPRRPRRCIGRRLAVRTHAYEHDPKAESYGLEAAERPASNPRRLQDARGRGRRQAHGGDRAGRAPARPQGAGRAARGKRAQMAESSTPSARPATSRRDQPARPAQARCRP